MELLLVEDDDAIAEPLVKGLERQGFAVRRESTGEGALRRWPPIPAPTSCCSTSACPTSTATRCAAGSAPTSSVPIIVITARGDEIDRVLGLELGADDYLVKPFGFRELVARIRAVTRRAGGRDDTAEGPVDVGGGVVIDTRAHRVTVDGDEIALTRKEFDLLALLASDPGATRTREEILEQVWDAHWYGPTKTLDVHVASLRRKLGDPTLVETVRGVGFRLRAPGARSRTRSPT